MMKKVIIMVGIPRSGKSTWVDRFVESVGEDICKVSSYDKIRHNLYGSKAHQGDFKVIKEVFDYGLVEALKDPCIEYILIDNTSLKKRYRESLVKFVQQRDKNALIFFKVMNTNILTILFRAIRTKFPLKVLFRMIKGYQKLASCEQDKQLLI